MKSPIKIYNTYEMHLSVKITKFQTIQIFGVQLPTNRRAKLPIINNLGNQNLKICYIKSTFFVLDFI